MLKYIDFIGFEFNGHHTSDYHMYHVSEGSRYIDNTLPNFKDTIADIIGSDGTLYWDSFFSNKTFSLSIAFDRMTEEDLANFKRDFNNKDTGDLIFDEAPYKVYSAKIQSPPQLKYICFYENNQRIYKGEGTIQFICYYPFARSKFKFLDEYVDLDPDEPPRYANKSEWSAASRMKSAQGNYDGSGITINLYNAGDIETDWIAYYEFNEDHECKLTQITLNDGTDGILNLASIINQNNDTYLRINSKTNLIEGCDSNKLPTGTLYNQFIISGDFFKIPLGQSTFTSNIDCESIKYDYLYY